MHPAVGVGIGAVAIALGAQVSVPMVPVPMTLQTLAVVAGGLLLGPRRGALAALAYLVLVLAGLPVLAEAARAWGPTFLQLKSAGYVVGFIPAAWVAGWIGARGGWLAWIGAGLAGHAVVLACGVPVLAAWIGGRAAIAYGLLPFLPGAIVKSALAAPTGWLRNRFLDGPSLE